MHSKKLSMLMFTQKSLKNVAMYVANIAIVLYGHRKKKHSDKLSLTAG